jgi:cystathionine beta-lyase/cystathionine gamma-synthase
VRVDPRDVALCATEEVAPVDGLAAPTSPPIVQTSLFTYPTLGALVDALGAEHRHAVYSRGRNPTVRALEDKLAALERGGAAACFASGMAAISAIMLGLLEAGDHVLFVNQTYGPTLQLAEHLARFGIRHDRVPDGDPAAVRAALRPATRLVWMESPGTMTFRVIDVEAIAAIARDHGALSCMDNSWSSPLLQKPLEMGVDLVVHSATKYLAGHSDVVAGAVVSNPERMQQIFYRAYLLNGGILPPFDAWLLLRGLRTLPVRLRQHEADALAVARFLADHPAVRVVHHPALEADPALTDRQMRGWSGLFSFELVRDDYERVEAVIDRLERFGIGVSWGGVESLVISPNRPGGTVRPGSAGVPPGLIRLSIGLEGADLLIDDLRAALDPEI